MKKNQIFILVFFFLVSALTYWQVFSNQKDPIKESKEANTEMHVRTELVVNASQKVSLSSYGQISPNQEIDVAFEVQGKLLSGFTQIKPGISFDKGQILFEIDKEENLANLKARKSQLANLLISILPEIELDYNESLDTWNNFLTLLTTEENLPKIPAVGSEKENMLLTSRGLLAEYYTILAMEKRMDKYVYRAPFNGSVLDLFSEPGSIVNPGVRICRIARTGNMEIKIPIALNAFDMFKKAKEATFYDNQGELIGKGKILRVSEVVNSKTQSIDVYYSIQPLNNAILYNGQFVNAEINKEIESMSFVLPRNAVKENKVNVLVEGKLVSKEINVLSTKTDSIVVSGLTNGEEVLLEGVIPNMDITKYIGIRN